MPLGKIPYFPSLLMFIIQSKTLLRQERLIITNFLPPKFISSVTDIGDYIK